MSKIPSIRGAKIPLPLRGDDAREMILPKEPVCYSSGMSEYKEWLMRQVEQMEEQRNEMMKKHPGISFVWETVEEEGQREDGAFYYSCKLELKADRPIED